MKPRFAKTSLFLSVIVLTGMTLSASADTIVSDGTGTMDFETGTDWVGDVAPVNDITTDIAQLTGGTVDLGADRSVGGLDLNSATTLSGTGVLRIGPGASAGLGLTGSGDLTLTGGGGIQLRDGNDHALNYTGDITVGAGTTLTSDRHSLKLDTGTHANTLITLDGGTIHGAYNHLDLAGRNIALTANGGTLFHKHARNFYNMSGQVISGAGQLTVKSEGSTASGRIELDNAVNTYTGGTRIESGGHIRANSNAALGLAGTSVTFNNGNIIASSVNFDTREFILEAGSYGQIETANSGSSIKGLISGGGEFIINGGGSVDIYSANNTYTGGTTIDGAQVNMRVQDAVFGTGDITLNNGGIIKNRDNNPTINNNIILGTGEGTYGGGTTGAQSGGQFEAGWSKNVYLNGVISGDGPLTVRNDSGTVFLRNAGNTYTGGTRLEGKVFGRTGALGTGNVIFNAGNLVTDNQHLSLGSTQAVTLEAGGGTVQVYNNKGMTFDGVVDGAGKLTVANDGGTLNLKNGANSYSGGTEIQGLVNAVSGSLGTGDITLNDVNGSRGQLKNNGRAATHANNVIVGANGGRMMAGWTSNLEITGVVSGSGALTIVGDSGTVVLSNAANTFTGDINLQDATSRLSVASLGGGTYGGVISGDAAATLAFTGDVTLTGDNTFTGAATVSSGNTLVIDGVSTSTLTTVQSGATISGSGTVGALTIDSGGSHNPGNSPGIMTVAGDYTLAGTLNAEVEGNTAGVGGYDQVSVTGLVNISGGSLNALFSGSSLVNGDLLFILLNDDTDAITGTFAGLAQGATGTSPGGFEWQISYAADSGTSNFLGGNDIALLVTAIPEPSAALLGALGLLALLRRRRD